MIAVFAALTQVDDLQEARESDQQGANECKGVLADDPHGLQEPGHPEQKQTKPEKHLFLLTPRRTETGSAPKVSFLFISLRFSSDLRLGQKVRIVNCA